MENLTEKLKQFGPSFLMTTVGAVAAAFAVAVFLVPVTISDVSEIVGNHIKRQPPAAPEKTAEA